MKMMEDVRQVGAPLALLPVARAIYLPGHRDVSHASMFTRITDDDHLSDRHCLKFQFRWTIKMS
jgi:hypothetical protein